ncbi:L-ascorbate oxidase-like protein [Hordeum vulgare]|nr:L-ascorbate oxidase-like protein [Hordeum vulgare]
MHSCCNSAGYIDVEYPTTRVMFLRRGWNTFARANNFMEGHVLYLKLMEADMLSVKIYGHSGACLGYCEESSSEAKRSSSSDSDKDGSSEPPARKSDYEGSGSS